MQFRCLRTKMFGKQELQNISVLLVISLTLLLHVFLCQKKRDHIFFLIIALCRLLEASHLGSQPSASLVFWANANSLQSCTLDLSWSRSRRILSTDQITPQLIFPQLDKLCHMNTLMVLVINSPYFRYSAHPPYSWAPSWMPVASVLCRHSLSTASMNPSW